MNSHKPNVISSAKSRRSAASKAWKAKLMRSQILHKLQHRTRESAERLVREELWHLRRKSADSEGEPAAAAMDCDDDDVLNHDVVSVPNYFTDAELLALLDEVIADEAARADDDFEEYLETYAPTSLEDCHSIQQQVHEIEEWSFHNFSSPDSVLCPICNNSPLRQSCTSGCLMEIWCARTSVTSVKCLSLTCPFTLREFKERLRIAHEMHSQTCRPDTLVFRQIGNQIFATCDICQLHCSL